MGVEERGAAENRGGSQCCDECIYPEPGNNQSVRQTGNKTDRKSNKSGQRKRDFLRFNGINRRTRSIDRANRQIKAASDHDKRHTQRDESNLNILTEDIEKVIPLKESRVENSAQHDKGDQQPHDHTAQDHSGNPCCGPPG